MSPTASVRKLSLTSHQPGTSVQKRKREAENWELKKRKRSRNKRKEKTNSRDTKSDSASDSQEIKIKQPSNNLAIPMQKLQDIQRAMELLSACQGPAKNIDEATKRKYQFWDTQPVPKLRPLDHQVGFRSGTVVSGCHPIGNWWGSSVPFLHTFGFMIGIVHDLKPGHLWFLSTDNGHIVTKNNNTDQKLSVLAVLGGVVLILLVLLCLLLYYCSRRKLLKPRQLFKKIRLSSISGSKKDQSTSTSNFNLVFSQHELEFPGRLSITSNSHLESFDHKEVVMADVHASQGCSVEEADMLTPVFLHTYSTSQEFSPREGWLSHEENDRSHMSLVSMASFFINPSKSLEKMEGSPDKGHSRHSYNTMLSQSLFEKPEQSRFSAELSSAHSQQEMQPQQRQPQHLAAQAVSQQHLQEAGTGDWKPQYIVVTESFQTQVQCTASLSDELLNKKAQIELGGGKSLPHPQAWFVSLDGKSNRVRHSYIDLQTSGRNGINDVNQDSTDNINEPKSARKGRAGHLQQTRQQVQMYPQKDLDEVDQSGSECETMACIPEDNSRRCVLEGGRRRRDGQLPSLQEETMKRNVESPSNSLPSPEHKITACSKADCDGCDTDDHQREDKKTPWQKREERPVILFNPK